MASYSTDYLHILGPKAEVDKVVEIANPQIGTDGSIREYLRGQDFHTLTSEVRNGPNLLDLEGLAQQAGIKETVLAFTFREESPQAGIGVRYKNGKIVEKFPSDIEYAALVPILDPLICPENEEAACGLFGIPHDGTNYPLYRAILGEPLPKDFSHPELTDEIRYSIAIQAQDLAEINRILPKLLTNEQQTGYAIGLVDTWVLQQKDPNHLELTQRIEFPKEVLIAEFHRITQQWEPESRKNGITTHGRLLHSLLGDPEIWAPYYKDLTNDLHQLELVMGKLDRQSQIEHQRILGLCTPTLAKIAKAYLSQGLADKHKKRRGSPK